MKHVDATGFAQQVGGSSALVVRIALAFVGQLPDWRDQFTESTDSAQLALLLHKMKGSCYAISASGAAQAFAQAEQALHQPSFKADQMPRLLALIAEIEAELQMLIEEHRPQPTLTGQHQ
jgi:HPt (histidine-containing phosphotransfer) domain-containing protein